MYKINQEMYKENEENKQHMVQLDEIKDNKFAFKAMTQQAKHVLEQSSLFKISDASKLRVKELERVLSKRDLKDIDKSLSEEMEQFRATHPNANQETCLAVENALRLSLTEIKIENKEKYNPYKNKSKGNS